MKPTVTILLATYNRAHLIGETLNSILNQTYKNWECIIIDDNSTDNTKAFVVNEFINKDTRFKFYTKDNFKYPQGLSGTRNMSLDLAEELKVKYIQFFDDDDIMHPRKLELQMKVFLKNTELDMTLCKYRKFSKKETIDFDLNTADDGFCNIETVNIFWDFYYHRIQLNSLGPIWNFHTIKSHRFDENLVTGEERDFYLRLFIDKKIKYNAVNYVLFWYRKHEKSITKAYYSNAVEYNKSLKIINKKIKNKIIRSSKFSKLIRLKMLIKLYL